MKQLLYTLTLLLLVGTAAQAIEVTKLTCNRQEGFVVVTESPRLGWSMTSTQNGARQTAYEIEIRSNDPKVASWRSGKIASSGSQQVSCAAAQLDPDGKSNYHWRVRVWDEADRASAWSRESTFRFAPQGLERGAWIGAITREDAHLPEGRRFHGSELKKPEVKALWEAVDTLAKKSIYLRKAFRTGREIREATAHVCGLGHYELTLNGTKVGDGEFTPLWSDYDKTLYYNTYDVTSLVRRGENVAGLLLGNGFYNLQGGRYRKLQISFGPPTLLFRLEVNYTDGTREVIASGADWKYDFSPITFNCIYGGEDYDARREQRGWDLPGFDDSRWRKVVVQEAPRGVLRPQRAAPVRIMEHYGVARKMELTPQEIAAASQSTKRTVDPSVFVLDMAQNLAGFPEIRVSGKRGDKITLLVAENLTKEGAVDQRQTGRQHSYEYTLKGDGVEAWHPRFSYYGFRYIQVEGAVMQGDKNPNRLPVLHQIRSCFIYNAARTCATFESSNPLFNATHRLIDRAVRSNMQSLFTDCPHREKLGWLEQLHLNGPGLLYNYDLTAYIPQLMQNMADAQHSNGAMPTTAPEYAIFEGPGMDVFAESPEWGNSLVLLPFMYRMAYGDDSLIRQYYPAMRRYVDYLTTRADNNILSFGLGDWYDYGDFRAGFSRNTPVPLVATAHYYQAIEGVAAAARLVGNSSDEARYRQLARQVKRDFNRSFGDANSGQYGTGSQCSNALPLFFQLPDSTATQQVLTNLIKDIEAHGNRLTTGDVGNRYLIQTLARNGQHELLYRMFNHEEAPGYGFQLKLGATTLTEQWDPRQGSSWNHFMMGQIEEWFFNSLVGIRPVESAPGCQLLEIRPQPVGDLTFVKGSVETAYGTVTVHWTREANRFTLRVTLPVNSRARIFLPGESRPHEVGSGQYQWINHLL